MPEELPDVSHSFGQIRKRINHTLERVGRINPAVDDALISLGEVIGQLRHLPETIGALDPGRALAEVERLNYQSSTIDFEEIERFLNSAESYLLNTMNLNVTLAGSLRDVAPCDQFCPRSGLTSVLDEVHSKLKQQPGNTKQKVNAFEGVVMEVLSVLLDANQTAKNMSSCVTVHDDALERLAGYLNMVRDVVEGPVAKAHDATVTFLDEMAYLFERSGAPIAYHRFW